MKSTKHLKIRHPIIIRPNDLQGIVSFLSSMFTEVKYKATCSDDTEFEPADLDELLAYENPSFRRLKAVQIKSVGLKGEEQSDSFLRAFPPNRVELTFEDKGGVITNPCNVQLEFADHKNQFATEDELTKRIRAMRPWYFWFTKMKFVDLALLIAIGMVLLLLVVTSLLMLLGRWKFPIDMPLTTVNIYPWSGFGVIACGSLYLLDRLRLFIMPNCWFCIGKQEQVLAKRQKITLRVLQFVGGSIILAIIVNLISALIEHRLFGS